MSLMTICHERDDLSLFKLCFKVAEIRVYFSELHPVSIQVLEADIACFCAFPWQASFRLGGPKMT